jgi:hypothetical protein
LKFHAARPLPGFSDEQTLPAVLWWATKPARDLSHHLWETRWLKWRLVRFSALIRKWVIYLRKLAFPFYAQTISLRIHVLG